MDIATLGIIKSIPGTAAQRAEAAQAAAEAAAETAQQYGYGMKIEDDTLYVFSGEESES